MGSERNTRHGAHASSAARAATMVMAALAAAILAGCEGSGSSQPTLGNTGPYSTVGSVKITAGAQTASVGDSLIYTAKAYDNAGHELPVSFTWHSVDYNVVDINETTGHAKALEPGATQIYATVGSAVSDYRTVTVR